MDCNRKRRTDHVDSRPSRRLPAMRLLMPALGMLPALCASNASAATEVNWLDIESRIQYAYYTQDVRALHRVLDALNATETTDAKICAGCVLLRDLLVPQTGTSAGHLIV